MIAPLLFLPVSLLATQITITEVSAEREGGRVTIDVKSDAMIDPEATSAKLSEGQLYLFVYDARVHENNRAWQNDVADGAEEIRAHRHKQKVELAIPLGDGGCQGPVELEKAAEGLRALVACEGAPRPSASRASHSPSAPASRAETKPESRVTQLPEAASPTTVKPDALNAALKAKLSLDPEPAPRAAPKAVVAAAAPAKAVSPTVKAAPTTTTSATTTTFLSTPTSGNHDVALANTGPSGGTNGGVVLGGVALLALACAAFYFSRRRASGSRRHIQILETASLGPKRSLVVARVGDATMILGTSEAGITLLQSVPDPDAAKPFGGGAAIPELSFAPAPAVVAPEPPAPRTPSDPTPPKILVEEAPVGSPVAIVPGAGGSNSWSLDKYGLPAIEEEPVSATDDVRPIGQAGLLSRLFKRGTPANDSPRFEDILEDSFEDQELRRKLALGLPGRVR
jgi:hypothetical protein